MNIWKLNADPETLARDLVDLSSIIKQITRRELKGEAGGDSLTLTQLRILAQIRDGVQNVGKLADFFGISQPATSIMVNTLVTEGYVERFAHPTDRRQIQLFLTAKAKSKLKTGYRRAYAALDRKLESLSSAKREALSKHLRELTNILSESEEFDHE